MTYQERLKALREDNDLTQQQIADYLGIAQTTYSQYELGKRSLPIEFLVALWFPPTRFSAFGNGNAALTGGNGMYHRIRELREDADLSQKQLETMTYQERLKALREDNDLTQHQIADYLGIAQTTYSQYELGKRSLPIEFLVALCRMNWENARCPSNSLSRCVGIIRSPPTRFSAFGNGNAAFKQHLIKYNQ